MKYSIFCFVFFLFFVVQTSATTSQDTVVDAWASALGGKDKLKAITSTYTRSSIATAEFSGIVENWSTATGQLKENALLGSVYKTTTIYDPAQKGGWIVDPNGAIKLLEGGDLRSQITAAYFGSFSLFLPDRLPGRVTYEGEDITKHFDVVKVQPEGGRDVTVYLDKVTHLPAKQEQQDGEKLLTILFSDYREVSGIRVPFQFRQTTGDPDDDVLIVLQEVKWNVPIDSKIFSRPTVPVDSSTE